MTRNSPTSDSSSRTPRYRRGPYLTYRKKYHSKKETSLEETQKMISILEDCRNSLHEIGPNQYKSKILENLQGLLDSLRKYEKRFCKTKDQSKIEALEARIKDLEEKIAWQDMTLDGDILFQDLNED